MKRCGRIVLMIVGVLAGQYASGQTRHELQIPDIAGYQTLKCDFHMHTVFFRWAGVADGARGRGLARRIGRDRNY